jgi:hypothetical protein
LDHQTYYKQGTAGAVKAFATCEAFQDKRVKPLTAKELTAATLVYYLVGV